MKVKQPETFDRPSWAKGETSFLDLLISDKPWKFEDE